MLFNVQKPHCGGEQSHLKAFIIHAELVCNVYLVTTVSFYRTHYNNRHNSDTGSISHSACFAGKQQEIFELNTFRASKYRNLKCRDSVLTFIVLQRLQRFRTDTDN